MIRILCILIPIIVSFLLVRFRDRSVVSKPGTVIWAYILGICFSLIINVATKGAVSDCVELLEIIAYISVAIGIPLLLFSNSIANLNVVSKDVKKAFLLLVLSVLAVTLILYFIYTKNIENGKVLSGMALAIYTGGTPNLNAVAYTFHLNSKVLLAANLSDIVIGGVFYLFIIFAAKILVRKKHSGFESDVKPEITGTYSSQKGAVRNLFIAICVALGSAGLGALVWVLAGKADGRLTDFIVPVMMIGTSIGGILLAKNKKISSVAENDVMGQFFITLFSFSIASLIDIDAIKNIGGGVFVVFLTITVATFFVHMLLCKVFKIDLRLMMVTATAGIYGPAFIPGLCKALDSDKLIPSGLIMGSLGYVIGTFLGCGLVLLL